VLLAAALLAAVLWLWQVAALRGEELGRSGAELEAAHAELTRRAHDLERSNADLARFAFVASHDLQEPLRKIETFASRLRRRLTPSNDPKAQDDIDRVINASSRMRGLIEDVLTYSQVRADARNLEEVNLGHEAQLILQDYEVTIDETAARIIIGDLPVLECDRSQVSQLLRNLIGNALKFRKPGSPPVVHVSSTLEGDRCEIAVEDEGIGFDTIPVVVLTTSRADQDVRASYQLAAAGSSPSR